MVGAPSPSVYLGNVPAVVADAVSTGGFAAAALNGAVIDATRSSDAS